MRLRKNLLIFFFFTRNGYILAVVTLSVCLFVCNLDYAKTISLTFLTPDGKAWDRSRKNLLNMGADVYAVVGPTMRGNVANTYLTISNPKRIHFHVFHQKLNMFTYLCLSFSPSPSLLLVDSLTRRERKERGK